jgi:hypothetical protein
VKLHVGTDVVGSYKSDVNVIYEQVITFELKPHVEYSLTLSKDKFTQAETLLQNEENRDSDQVSFSLKLDFA